MVKKRETVLADTLEKKILGMYGLGMSFRDISSHLKEMYDADISHSTLSAITDRIIPTIKEWQARSLEAMYCIVWLDAMHYKVKDEGRVVSRAVYHILGINIEGRKELIGMYVSESEGSNFWLGVLSDLRNRGVEDILIASIDNLKGFAEAIQSTFPKAEIQSCIVHQIRSPNPSRDYLTTTSTNYTFLRRATLTTVGRDTHYRLPLTFYNLPVTLQTRRLATLLDFRF